MHTTNEFKVLQIHQGLRGGTRAPAIETLTSHLLLLTEQDNFFLVFFYSL